MLDASIFVTWILDATGDEYQILNGRWGPYLKAGKLNVRIPKDRDPASLTLEDCIKLAEESAEKKKTKPKRKVRSKKG